MKPKEPDQSSTGDRTSATTSLATLVRYPSCDNSIGCVGFHHSTRYLGVPYAPNFPRRHGRCDMLLGLACPFDQPPHQVRTWVGNPQHEGCCLLRHDQLRSETGSDWSVEECKTMNWAASSVAGSGEHFLHRQSQYVDRGGKW